MTELIRDTAFGHIVRFVSRGKFLQYQEERDPSIWKKFIDEKASGNLAHHGTTDPPVDGEEPEKENEKDQRSGSESSSRTKVGGDVNRASGVKVDPEKGKDLEVVTWYNDSDPENPQNWSTGKKCFVTFEICLLTTSIYIGSSIYSAGTQSVMATFGVSQVAATLGLSLFVAGYGLGPMLWSPMSEIPQIGRNPIYLVTLLIFVALQAPTALASNFGMLLAFRFITGFFGSPVLATGGASLGDIWAPKKRAYAISIWVSIQGLCSCYSDDTDILTGYRCHLWTNFGTPRCKSTLAPYESVSASNWHAGWIRSTVWTIWFRRLHSTVDLANLGADVALRLLLRFPVLFLPRDQREQRKWMADCYQFQQTC